MATDVSSYFESGFHQLRCTPRLIIPFLMSNALFYAVVWVIIFSLALVSLPIIGEIAPIIEKKQNLISEILAEKHLGDSDQQIQELVRELSSLIPKGIYLFILFLLALFIIIIISFILFAWVSAGTIGYIWQGITASLDFKNFLYYAKKYLFRITGLLALIIVFSIILFLIPFSSLVLIPAPANILVFILLMLLFFILWLIAMLLLFFTEECIVIEDKSILESIKRSKDIVTGNFGSILLFIIILIAMLIIYGIVSVIFEVIATIFNSSFSSFLALFSLIILIPWIQLAKLNFFLDRTGRTIKVMEKEVELIKAFKEFIIESPYILVNFAKKNIVYILAAISFFMVGIGIGYYIGNSFSFLSQEILMLLSKEWENRLLGPYISMPLIDLIDYFSNNSIVGINQGLSGLFLGIPSIVGIAIIGIITGLFYGIFPAKTATAFLAVHGVFEITAFVITTAAGIRLGVRFLKGSANEILEETLKVALAALLLIGIAAFLEAFITPIVISLVI